MAIATTNPATGETLQRFDEISDEELEFRLDRASAVFTQLRLSTFAERSAWMTRAAELIAAEHEQVAGMLTTEMGKTIRSARAEVVKCAAVPVTTPSVRKPF